MLQKESPMIRYYLGIDGGGTKTAFRLEGETNDETALKELTLGASNPNDIGMDACLALLSEGVGKVCDGIDLAEVSAFAGIAGYASGDNGVRIDRHLKSLGFGMVRGGSDFENALALSRMMAGDEVVAIIAGTGSVAYSLHGGKRKMTGGLGYMLDSVGSAFYIGREGLVAAFKAMDGRGDATALTALCEEKLVMPLASSIAKIYQGGKPFIASFAPLVFEAARMGDAAAADVLDRNGRGMAELIETALKPFGDRETPVVIAGGLCHESDMLDESIRRYIGPEQTIIYTVEPMVKGCVFLARELALETPF